MKLSSISKTFSMLAAAAMLSGCVYYPDPRSYDYRASNHPANLPQQQPQRVIVQPRIIYNPHPHNYATRNYMGHQPIIPLGIPFGYGHTGFHRRHHRGFHGRYPFYPY
jgi:hypothetical protein